MARKGPVELSKQLSQRQLPRMSALRFNVMFHSAAMTGCGTFAVAFLHFASDAIAALAVGAISLVVFVFLVVTGLICLIDNGVFHR